MTNSEAQQFIKTLHRAFPGTPVQLVEIAHFLGVRAYFSPDFKETELGAVQKQQSGYEIFINEDQRSEQKYVALAVGIGHTMLHKRYLDTYEEIVIPNKISVPTRKLPNQEAMAYDAYNLALDLTMPEEDIKQYCLDNPALAEDAVYAIADEFNTPVSTTINRMSQVFGRDIFEPTCQPN